MLIAWQWYEDEWIAENYYVGFFFSIKNFFLHAKITFWSFKHFVHWIGSTALIFGENAF